MCGRAAKRMQIALDHQLGLPVPLVDSFDSLGNWYASLEPVCYAHVARNPFEMVVSGYLYNMAESESWLNEWTFGQASASLDSHSKQLHERAALAEVFRSSRSGPLAAWLPEANANETYPDYLKRVDLDAGLLAESIVGSSLSLTPMRLAEDFTESHHCSVHVCFEDFFENCSATWNRVLQAWQIPEPSYDAMLRAATESCPGVDPHAVEHSSGSQMENMDLKHVPEHVMVNRLKELDRLRLNGRIAALEEHVKCHVSGKYKEPA